jgi:hypothetical protein
MLGHDDRGAFRNLPVQGSGRAETPWELNIDQSDMGRKF